MDSKTTDFTFFLKKTLVAFIALLVVFIIWQSIQIWFLLFAAILLGLFFNGLSETLAAKSGLSYKWSLVTVLILITGLTALTFWFLAPNLAQQGEELYRKIPEALQTLKDKVSRHTLGQEVIDKVPEPAEMLQENGSSFMKRAAGAFSTTVGALANIIIILFIGLYLAIEPSVYKNGLVKLFPFAKRERAAEVLENIADTLKNWLKGQITAMFIIGVFTTIGLWALNIPLALTLGIIAMVLTFIPNIGPILSVVPAALLALLESPAKLLLVIGLYIVIQTIESYILTPLIQKKAVSLPPVLIIFSQVLLGVLVGGIGLALATPLMVAVMVTVKMVYIQDTLGDSNVQVK